MMKARMPYFISVIICIVLGLGSRTYSGLLPVFIAEHAGDMLWASMVYFGFRFLFTSKSLAWAAAGSLLFSFGIEFSQLYQAEWIVKLRHTLLGALIIGRGFLTLDLIRYALGVTIAFGVDKFGLRRKS
ncbi:DUF2809 domain-containing protein [Paenibacillus piri]|nr:DUF2809 domain-containing protein [Paenibacillus piri]